MAPRDLIDALRSRINPAYAEQVGTESWERRLCVEALEAQADEIERLRAEIDQLREINAGLRRHANGVADDNRKLLAEVEVMKRQKPAAWMCPDDPDSATAFSWKPVTCELASCLKRRVPLYLAPGAQTAQTAPSMPKWVLTKDKPHPDKPGLESYEHVPCLIVKSGEIMLRQWNCEHLVWDTEDGDDFYCSARDVTHWMPIQTPPSEQENNDGRN